MSEEAIKRDLTRKIAGQIEELLQREILIAQKALSGTALIELLLFIGASVSASAIATMLQFKPEEVDAGEAFDAFAGLIDSLIASRKAEVLDAAALVAAGKTAEARAKYGSGR